MIKQKTSKITPFGDRVPASPFHFDDHEKLVASLADTDVLYNTYWIRFNYGESTTAMAVENSVKLFAAAKEAGVVRPKDYAIIQNHGYMGLYGGLTQTDIHRRKGLKKS